MSAARLASAVKVHHIGVVSSHQPCSSAEIQSALLELYLTPLHAGNVRDNATAAHDAILEMLNLHDKGRGRLGDSSNSSGQQAGSFPGQGQGPGRPGSFS